MKWEAKFREAARKGMLKSNCDDERILKILSSGVTVASILKRINDNIRKRRKCPRPEWRTERYQRWRYKVLERDNYTCQMCKEIEGILDVHHIELWSECKNKRYKVSNGITLCRDCHRSIRRKESHYTIIFKSIAKSA